MMARRMAVVGLGTMGAGIAITGLVAGWRVVGREVSRASLDAGVERVQTFLDGSVRRGKLTQDAHTAALSRFEGTTSLADVADAELVIEAVPEDLDLKGALLARLDEVCGSDPLIATNTSTLSVTQIAAASQRPDRVVGLHFCNPAPLMKLVEVGRGLQTSDTSYQRALDVVAALNKVPVTTQDTPGFLVNRFLVPFENDAIRLLEAGRGTPEAIDMAAEKGMGHPMGPFRLLDIVGLDIHHSVSMSLYNQLRDQRFAPPPLVDRMIAAGRLGRKTGRGFYSYEKAGVFGA